MMCRIAYPVDTVKFLDTMAATFGVNALPFVLAAVRLLENQPISIVLMYSIRPTIGYSLAVERALLSVKTPRREISPNARSLSL